MPITAYDFLAVPANMAGDRQSVCELVATAYEVLKPLHREGGPHGDGRPATARGLAHTIAARLAETTMGLGLTRAMILRAAGNLASILEASSLFTVETPDGHDQGPPYEGDETVALTVKGDMFLSWAESLEGPDEVL